MPLSLPVSAEQAAQILGCYVTLSEIVLPILRAEPAASHDPRTIGQLERAADALAKAMDRAMVERPRLKGDLHDMLYRRVLVLDKGQVGILDACEKAVTAFEDARRRPGAPPSRDRFAELLQASLQAIHTPKEVTPHDQQDQRRPDRPARPPHEPRQPGGRRRHRPGD